MADVIVHVATFYPVDITASWRVIRKLSTQHETTEPKLNIVSLMLQSTVNNGVPES